MSHNFRELLPGPDHRASAGIAERDAYSHADRVLANPRGQAFIAAWHERLAQPFVGVTADGEIVPALYKLESHAAPVSAMLAAARTLLGVCSDAQRHTLRFALDAPNWRMWSNPELYVNRYGLRMDELALPLQAAILEVLRASLSPRGFEKARACMLMNEFLGQLVGGPRVPQPIQLQLLIVWRAFADRAVGLAAARASLGAQLLGGQQTDRDLSDLHGR
jgi:hypothetical protein